MNRRRALETSTARLWIEEARDHLKIAGKHEPGLNLRLLCAEAHMGAEKAVKGVIIARREVFPYTHDIGALLDRAERSGEAIPDEVRKGDADGLQRRRQVPGHGRRSGNDNERGIRRGPRRRGGHRRLGGPACRDARFEG